MKDQFLKLAGAKNEKEFYKLFPTEEAFMAKYGKQVKKLQVGAMIQGSTKPTNTFQPMDFQKIYDQNDKFITGSTDTERQQQAYSQQMLGAQQKMANKKGLGDILGDVASVASTAAQFAGSAGGGAKNGKRLKKALFGDETIPMDKTKGNKTLETISKYAGPAGKVYEGYQQMQDEKEKLARAEQMKGVSDVSLQASLSRPEPVQRRYVRPEDNVNTGEPFFPVFGVGTTLAKNGAEIANTFAPNTIYTDLEQAKDGWFSNSSSDFGQGLYAFADKGGADVIGDLTQGLGNPKGYGNSGAGKIGGTIGGTAGTLLFGPVGGMVGKFAGQTIGNVLDRKAEKTVAANEATQANVEKMALNQGAQALQQQNYSYMKRGGMVNPQVATSLEGIPLTRLFAPDPYMDTLRTGGNIRQNNMAMGGDLRSHWGGGAEPISYNPYLPKGGETVMFKGQSHDESDGRGNTGIGITYGDNPVEVERGEPAVQLRDGSRGDTNLTVYGNLKIPSFGAQMIGDPKAKGKKFKNYVADLSKTEQRQNKIMEKSTKALDDLDVNNSFDKLSFGSYQANMLGANMKLKEIADKKIKAASLQSAINDTADQFGLVADDLAKGKVKQAKMGAKLSIAKDGFTMDEQKKAKEYYEAGKKSVDISQFQKYASEIAPDLVKSSIDKYGMPAAGSFIDKRRGKRTDEVYTGITDATRLIPEEPGMPSDISVDTSGMKKAGTIQDMVDYFKGQVPAMKRPFDETKSDKFDWTTIANQILPYMRPTNAEELDPRQLAGEMYALSTNQVEPVNAQLFRPQLNTPYDISLQDQLNANQSDYRAAQRMMGYNPAAQATLNAQKYQANQQVLGEQFRMNQAMRDKVFGENRQLIDQANLQNLGILDQQYGRQQQALSNTKATTQAALNSISAKYLQNQSENRTLQTYENMYNYRFDPRFRAMNMNPLAQFDIQADGAITMLDKEGKPVTYVKQEQKYDKNNLPDGSKVTTTTKSSRNGDLVKAMK